MAHVHIEIDDYIDSVSTETLRHEVSRRIARGQWKGAAPVTEEGAEPWAPDTLAEDIRLAFYARNASRLEALLVVLERHCDASFGVDL